MAGIDFQTEFDAIKRRRDVANSYLSKIGQSGIQTVGADGRHVAMGNRLLLEPIVNALVGMGLNKQQDRQQAALMGQYQDALGTEVSDYLTTRETDPRAAVVKAMASRIPEMREIGKAEFGALTQRPEGLDLKTLAGKASAESVLANPNDPSKWVSERGDPIIIDGVPFDKHTRTRWDTAPVEPIPTFKDAEGEDAYVNPYSGITHKISGGPRVNISTSVNPVIGGQRSGLEAAFKNAAEQVHMYGQVAANSAEMLQSLEQLDQLDTEGIHSNMPAGVVTKLANLAQSVGMTIDTRKLANSETYGTIMIDLWQRKVSQYGGNRGVTKEEAEQIKEMLPLATYSPQARRQIRDIYRKAAYRTLQAYQDANASFMEAAAAEDPRLFKIPSLFQQTYTPDSLVPKKQGGQPAQTGEPIPVDKLSPQQRQQLMNYLQRGQ